MSEAPCPPPREPTRPVVATPPQACDTHCHVFGPAAQFPYAADRSYTPPDAPLAKYLALLDTLGFARGALVQGSAHGRDNAAMLDALERHPDRLRGVAVADRDTPAVDFGTWDALGVRGLRFNHFFRDGQLHYRGGVPLEDAKILAADPEGSRLAPAALDRREGPARHDPDPEGDRPAGGDRPHGPHRRAGRHRGARLPGAAAPARRRRLLGEAFGRAPRQPAGAGLSGRARAARRAGEGKSRAAGVGLGLAASAHGRRDAERRPPARPVQRMDRGRRDPPPHPGRQSGEALRVSGASHAATADRYIPRPSGS